MTNRWRWGSNISGRSFSDVRILEDIWGRFSCGKRLLLMFSVVGMTLFLVAVGMCRNRKGRGRAELLGLKSMGPNGIDGGWRGAAGFSTVAAAAVFGEDLCLL